MPGTLLSTLTALTLAVIVQGGPFGEGRFSGGTACAPPDCTVFLPVPPLGGSEV